MHPWIEAMRLRTLPVSLAGVMTGAALALIYGVEFRWLPLLLCALFALCAQIASNFANEYYDYKDGLDRPGRDGPRRGVTEGDISPRAMLTASYATLALACLIGLGLLFWGGWWLIGVGVVIALAALAYSAGPWPLSRYGLGEVAVLIFFGLVPVTLTFWLVGATTVVWQVWCAAVGIGLLGANVLVVNNYRDIDDDRAVGKKTLAVRFGRRFALGLYQCNIDAALLLLAPVLWSINPYCVMLLLLWALLLQRIYTKICRSQGPALNPLLGATAMSMVIVATTLLICAVMAYWCR